MPYYLSTGAWEKPLAEFQEAARLEPHTAYPQSNQVVMYRCLGRFGEAKVIAATLIVQKLGSPNTHTALLSLPI